MKKLVLAVIAAALGVVSAPAQAFTHPCIPNTLQELDTIKANLDKEPWETGYAALAGDSKSQLTYVANGPRESVGRTPDAGTAFSPAL